MLLLKNPMEKIDEQCSLFWKELIYKLIFDSNMNCLVLKCTDLKAFVVSMQSLLMLLVKVCRKGTFT